MEIVYTEKAKADIAWWKKSGNKQIQKRITELLTSITATPFEGIGKPELLKYELSGKWSRRITQEHRIVYEVGENSVIIISLLYHYSK
jgi:toxin YoeB